MSIHSFSLISKFQVPPAELEQLLQSNPAIADAAVIPYVSLLWPILIKYLLACLEFLRCCSNNHCLF